MRVNINKGGEKIVSTAERLLRGLVQRITRINELRISTTNYADKRISTANCADKRIAD